MTENQTYSSINSPLELGLRSLFVLGKIYPDKIDLQRLIYYDYLILHTKDIEGGPESLHPNYPHRSAEILIKRNILQKGLLIMKSKELVEILFESSGIYYSATQLTKPFLEYYNSHYSKKLTNSVNFVIKNFHSLSDDNLNTFFSENIQKWGGEFIFEAYIRSEMNYE